MSKNIFILGASAIIATAFAFGCGSSDDTSSTATTAATTSSTGGASTTSSTTKAASTGAGASSASTATSMGGAGGSAALSCTDYCTTLMANCTGNDAQFSSMASCVGTCSAYPVGMTTDTTGDTLGCRTYHAGAAAGSQANADLHCQHAGPLGGGANFCGSADPCDEFCEIAIHACTGANEQFGGDKATCKTACDGFTMDTAAYNDKDTGTNDFYCRMYHLSVAADGVAADATTHCPHIVAASAVCIGM